MPNLDRTGPHGDGPRTGWAQGLCRRITASDDTPSNDAPNPSGRGMGKGGGRGQGFGRGAGRRFGRGRGAGRG